MRLASLLTCLTLTVITACGGDDTTATPDAPTAPREVITDVRTLGVGEISEGVLAGGPGDRVAIALTAPTPTLDWNLHGHAGGSTQTVAEGLAVTTVTYDFVPSAEADWFLLLRNGGGAPLDVTVRLELYGDVTWSGWQ